MNYLKIVLRGFLDENTRNYLEKYFLREYKKAEKEQFFETNEFFSGCLNVIEDWEKYFEKEAFTYLKELVNTLEKTKDGTFSVNAMEGKTIEQSKQELIEYYEREIKKVTDYDIIGADNAQITKTLRLKIKNVDISYNLTYSELLQIKESILIAFQKTQPQPEEKKEDDQPLFLKDLFEHTSKYQKIMEILTEKGYIEPFTYIWKDYNNAYKKFLSSMIKNLHFKGYFKVEIPTPSIIKNICENTFRLKIGIDTIKHSKNDEFDFSFIPIASTIN